VSSAFENLWMLTPWSIELITLCLRNRPDVVFIGQLLPVGVLGLLVQRLFKIPFIVFIHGEELATVTHLGGYRLRISECILRNAQRIITNSSFTRSLVLDRGIEEKRVEKITPMVDTDVFHANHDVTQLKNDLKIRDEKVLLSVGRLTPRKGHSRVISILPRLISTFGKLKYVIVGADVGESQNLRKLAADLGVEGSVIFSGRVSAEDLPKYYCLCDVMVLPNYELSNQDTEGFGMVFLEANACGKPAVGGRAGGTEDAVLHGETGLLVDPTDGDALLEALSGLLSDNTYMKRLGQNGRNRVVSSFNWNKAAAAVYKLGLQAMEEQNTLT
jgi:phosphatidylinositol alpha-1,6-mannosyltransferase